MALEMFEKVVKMGEAVKEIKVEVVVELKEEEEEEEAMDMLEK